MLALQLISWIKLPWLHITCSPPLPQSNSERWAPPPRSRKIPAPAELSFFHVYFFFLSLYSAHLLFYKCLFLSQFMHHMYIPHVYCCVLECDICFLLMGRYCTKENALLKGMMKFSGYSLAVSFSPVGSTVIRNNCRFHVGRNFRSSSRFFSAKQQSHDKGVLPNYYLPPWFRWVLPVVSTYFCCCCPLYCWNCEQMWLSRPKSWSRCGFRNLQNLDMAAEITVVDLDLKPWLWLWVFCWFYWHVLVFVFRWLNFSVAPMMEWTDHHYRTLARLISKHAWLYTEMLAAETIVYQQDNLVSLDCLLTENKVWKRKEKKELKGFYYANS